MSGLGEYTDDLNREGPVLEPGRKPRPLRGHGAKSAKKKRGERRDFLIMGIEVSDED